MQSILVKTNSFLKHLLNTNWITYTSSEDNKEWWRERKIKNFYKMLFSSLLLTCKVNFSTSCNLNRKDMHYSHLIRIKSNFMQVSIITLITYFFSIKIQFAHKTPLNPKRDVNKKALCKTRNPVVCFVWYDQGPISNHSFLLSKSTFHRPVRLPCYCN